MEAFHHCVVFVGEATIKNPEKMPPTLASTPGKLVAYIQSITEEIFDEETVVEIARRIEAYRLENTRQNTKAHIAYLKEKHR
jgi:hypothetical protein